VVGVVPAAEESVTEVAAEPIPLDIHFEDEAVLVILQLCRAVALCTGWTRTPPAWS